MVVTVTTNKDGDGCALSGNIVSLLPEESRITGALFHGLLVLATHLIFGED